jgi:hypothetical protein
MATQHAIQARSSHRCSSTRGRLVHGRPRSMQSMPCKHRSGKNALAQVCVCTCTDIVSSCKTTVTRVVPVHRTLRATTNRAARDATIITVTVMYNRGGISSRPPRPVQGADIAAYNVCLPMVVLPSPVRGVIKQESDINADDLKTTSCHVCACATHRLEASARRPTLAKRHMRQTGAVARGQTGGMGYLLSVVVDTRAHTRARAERCVKSNKIAAPFEVA